MTRSVAIIGAGQIGYANAFAFRDAGYEVRVCARTRPEWLHRDMAFEPYTLGESPVPCADVVVDTIAFDEDDVARYDPGRVGRYIAISSASVYRDHEARSLETGPLTGYPDFGHAITEDNPTVRAGPESYSSRKVRMERKARDLFGARSTILRPCAIYGPYSRHAREWWFVNRIKDRRRVIPLAFEGESVFHTTSAFSMGDFAAFLADKDLGGVWNVADDDAPSVREIGQTIAALTGKRVRFYGIEGPPRGTVGRTPWSVPHPFVLDTRKALEAGFEGFGYYAQNLRPALDYLRSVSADDWKSAFAPLAAYGYDHFDYDAEDRLIDEGA
jgi:nucleoside-diphosphate-sugar epimerase